MGNVFFLSITVHESPHAKNLYCNYLIRPAHGKLHGRLQMSTSSFFIYYDQALGTDYYYNNKKKTYYKHLYINIF